MLSATPALWGATRAARWRACASIVRNDLEPALARYGGRLVKLTGDGALAEFPSAVDALGAAIEFQQAMAEANGEKPEDIAIVFRIGLHLGDLIVEGDDLYGDGVNIAARLEAEAPPGGIIVSRAMSEAVEGRLKAKLHALGELTLKNIDRPVQAFSVKWQPEDWQPSATPDGTAAATAASQTSPTPLPLPDKPSIAVLPFQNISGDPEQDYFADGMVEEIITALSAFKSLFVIARNSSFTYKGGVVDVKQVGRELGVRYVLEGSVRKSGGKVRITGQLVDSQAGTHLWAERFDGAFEDIFDLQDQVTGRVVAAVAPRVEQAEIERSRHRPAKNLDAYDCYLRGLARANVITRQGLEEALQLARRAIDLDPDFSAAYGLAAFCHGWRQMQGFIEDQEREQSDVRRLAARVSLIGRDDAYALSLTAFALVRVCRDHEMGTVLADQALAVNSNLPAALYHRAEANLYQGNHSATIEQVTRAIRLSPRDPMMLAAEHLMAFAHLFEGQYAEAIAWATRALSRIPDNAAALRGAACAYALSGRMEEAAKCAARHRDLVPSYSVAETRKRSLYRRPRDRERFFEGLRLAGFPE